MFFLHSSQRTSRKKIPVVVCAHKKKQTKLRSSIVASYKKLESLISSEVSRLREDESHRQSLIKFARESPQSVDFRSVNNIYKSVHSYHISRFKLDAWNKCIADIDTIAKEVAEKAEDMFGRRENGDFDVGQPEGNADSEMGVVDVFGKVLVTQRKLNHFLASVPARMADSDEHPITSMEVPSPTPCKSFYRCIEKMILKYQGKHRGVFLLVPFFVFDFFFGLQLSQETASPFLI